MTTFSNDLGGFLSFVLSALLLVGLFLVVRWFWRSSRADMGHDGGNQGASGGSSGRAETKGPGRPGAR